MRLLTAFLLLLAVPVGAAPGNEPGAFTLRYRVSPGDAYAHEVSMGVRIRVLSSRNVCPPPPQLRAGMSHQISGRVITLIGRATAPGAHEALCQAKMQVRIAGRKVAVSSPAPKVGTLTSRGLIGEAGARSSDQAVSERYGHGALVFDRLPEAALRPGVVWSREARQAIPGGPTLTLRTQSRYLGRKEVDGVPCALIEEKATLPRILFRERRIVGTVSGRARALALYSLATGVPRRGTATLHWTLAFAGKGGKRACVGVESSVRIRQVSPTPWESSLARQAAAEGAWSVAADLAATPVMASAPTGPAASKGSPRPARRGTIRTHLEEAALAATARRGTAPLEGAAGPAAAHSVLAVPDASEGGAARNTGAAPVSSAPPLRILSPGPGARVAGDVVVTAGAAEGGRPQFLVFTVDGARVAAVGGPPYQCRLPQGALTPGVHTLGVEAYTGSHLPTATASVRVRALP